MSAQVSEMFGGLDICSLEAVVGKDGQEVSISTSTAANTLSLPLQVIIEVNDCALNLMGESQEEDRRQIAEMVVQQMEVQCLPATHTNGVVESTSKNLLEKSTERVEEKDLKGEERKEKSLPGPIQRGPQRRISSGQGRIHLSTNRSISPTHRPNWSIMQVLNHLPCRLLRFNRLDLSSNQSEPAAHFLPLTESCLFTRFRQLDRL